MDNESKKLLLELIEVEKDIEGATRGLDVSLSSMLLCIEVNFTHADFESYQQDTLRIISDKITGISELLKRALKRISAKTEDYK